MEDGFPGEETAVCGEDEGVGAVRLSSSEQNWARKKSETSQPLLENGTRGCLQTPRQTARVRRNVRETPRV